jgi:DNA-binding transcriptional ArsR family regulator
MEDDPTEPRALFEIEDLSTLNVITAPLRVRILHLLIKMPYTVKQLGQTLELPVTQLYYHVNMMLKAGIINVTSSKKVGEMTQRSFRAVAAEYSPAESLLEAIQADPRMAELLTSLIVEGARVDTEALLASRRDEPDSPEAQGLVVRTYFKLQPERLDYWTTKLSDVFDEMKEEADADEAAPLYGLTFVLAPLAAPLRGDG